MLQRKLAKRRGWGLILIPTFVVFVGSLTTFLGDSFGVYLKYQAFVDTYYEKEIQNKLIIEDGTASAQA